ncbi:hypothetical protein [Streptomyces malaysiensis]|uniref:hypothetical protein n=1 Tax=Streptomyces malaysiensis TaxID=92644 RepID=UPI002B318915|nr:hypothetical protein R8789_00020 [Streptomyces malaysiensis]WPB96036.1 hypothetical protein R8789_46785 [Streptomyces malaysiensis]
MEFGRNEERLHQRPVAAESAASKLHAPAEVDGLDLHVTDLDAIDGTPVYDLGPYFTITGLRDVRRFPWPENAQRDYWALWTV